LFLTRLRYIVLLDDELLRVFTLKGLNFADFAHFCESPRYKSPRKNLSMKNKKASRLQLSRFYLESFFLQFGNPREF